MAKGFRGMRDDFMEIINHIIGLCSVAHDDDDGALLPLPLPAASDSANLEASQVNFTSKLRDSAAAEDAPRSTLVCTALVNDGTGVYPHSELIVNAEDVDPSFVVMNNKLNENFWREYHTYLNIKLNKNDNEVIPSVQILQEKCTRQNRLKSITDSTAQEDAQVTNSEIRFDSSSDFEDYCYYKKEGEYVAIKKHFSSECILVEDHMPCIAFGKGMQLRSPCENTAEEEIRDFHQVDDCEFVIV